MSDHTRDPSVGPPATGNPAGWLPAEARWKHDTLRRATAHGIRLFNDGAYHEAHDCFEAEWYNYGRGRPESRFCHGMVQVAAGAYKYHDFDDREGMRSLFRTALDYLVDLPADFYGVDLRDVRRTLDAARATPAELDGWRLTIDGTRPVAGPSDYAHVERIDD